MSDESGARYEGPLPLLKVVGHPVFQELFDGFEGAVLREGDLASQCSLILRHKGFQEILHLERGTHADSPISPRFIKEQWARGKVKHVIPGPPVTRVGKFSVPPSDHAESLHYSFLLESSPLYISGSCHWGQSASRIEILTSLGQLAKKISEVPVQGFGDKFDGNSFFYSTWQRFLDGMVLTSGLSELCSTKVLTPRLAGLILDRVDGLALVPAAPRLYHGALVNGFSNILLTSDLQVAGVIEWGVAGGGPAGAMEMAHSLMSLGIGVRQRRQVREEFECFLRGFGISYDDYRISYQHLTEGVILLLALTSLTDHFKAGGGTLGEQGRELISLIIDLLGTGPEAFLG